MERFCIGFGDKSECRRQKSPDVSQSRQLTDDVICGGEACGEGEESDELCFE